MQKKQLKIFTLAGFFILLTFLLLFSNRKYFAIDNRYFFEPISSYRFRWKITQDTIKNQDDLKGFNLPNFEEEAALNGNWSLKPWFATWGEVQANKSTEPPLSLFPDPKNPYDDRITKQLMYVPPSYSSVTPHKLILLYDYIGDWLPHEEGSGPFQGCPVNRCKFTTQKSRLKNADAVIFGENSFSMPARLKSNGQVWIIYMLESPAHTKEIHPANVFNWTMTYRPDSDIAIPYAKWFYHGSKHKKSRPLRNFAANKTLKVAWFVSNCQAKNLRNEYAYELGKYIQVDIFGKCGHISCPRKQEHKCYKLLAKSYKFYLAFENSNCNYYITEKYFKNALRHNVIPIVMGARREDYARLGPEGSFIHVDDFNSPLELAQHLHILDKDDELYNKYFLWRGTGEFIYDRYFCRLCTLLHSNSPTKHYKDINHWWRRNHACSTDY